MRRHVNAGHVSHGTGRRHGAMKPCPSAAFLGPCVALGGAHSFSGAASLCSGRRGHSTFLGSEAPALKPACPVSTKLQAPTNIPCWMTCRVMKTTGVKASLWGHQSR